MKSYKPKDNEPIFADHGGESLSKDEIDAMLGPDANGWKTPKLPNFESFRKSILSEPTKYEPPETKSLEPISDGSFGDLSLGPSTDVQVYQRPTIHMLKTDFENIYKDVGVEKPKPLIRIGSVEIYRLFICPRCFSIVKDKKFFSYEEYLVSDRKENWRELTRYLWYNCEKCGNESLYTIVYAEPDKKFPGYQIQKMELEFYKASKKLGIPLFNKNDNTLQDDGKRIQFYWDNLCTDGTEPFNRFPEDLILNQLRYLNLRDLESILNGEKEIAAMGTSYEFLSEEEKTLLREEK